MPRLVVVAVDCSPSATHAAIYAAGVARRGGATLLLVHVCRPSIVWPDLGMATADYLEATRPSLEVSALVSTISRDLGVDIEIAVALGSPAREVARIANDRHAALVVAGDSYSLRHRVADRFPHGWPAGAAGRSSRRREPGRLLHLHPRPPT